MTSTSEIYKKWIKGFLYKLYLNEWLSNAWFSVFYLQRITLFLLCLHLFCYHVIDLHFHSSWSTLYSMVWHESYQWIEKRNFYPQCQLLQNKAGCYCDLRTGYWWFSLLHGVDGAPVLTLSPLSRSATTLIFQYGHYSHHYFSILQILFFTVAVKMFS